MITAIELIEKRNKLIDEVSVHDLNFALDKLNDIVQQLNDKGMTIFTGQLKDFVPQCESLNWKFRKALAKKLEELGYNYNDEYKCNHEVWFTISWS